jgi:hypothetical protein
MPAVTDGTPTRSESWAVAGDFRLEEPLSIIGGPQALTKRARRRGPGRLQRRYPNLWGVETPAALAFRRILDDTVKRRRLRIVWVDETKEREAWRVLEQYRDVTLSLTDATTVVAARRGRIGEIFGLDRDFEALGLVVLPGSRRKER